MEDAPPGVHLWPDRTVGPHCAVARPVVAHVVGTVLGCLSVLVLGVSLIACSKAGPIRVSLRTLVDDQQALVGRVVQATGTVVSFRDPSGPYFVLQDARLDRVELVPRWRVARYSGRRVTVEGTFGFNEHIGRFIRVSRIDPADRATEASP